MKFEKLSDTKIRITVTIQDLVEKDIDFNTFMANTIESQDILLNMLDEAKKETGFDPENYNLKIEALAMPDSNFIFTITKIIPDDKPMSVKKKFCAKRKNTVPNAILNVYSFNSFDDFCNFSMYLKNCFSLDDITKIATCVMLYTYRGKYYLLMDEICSEISNNLKFTAIASEFGKYVFNSKLFACKLRECGEVLIHHNALEVGCTYFATK